MDSKGRINYARLGLTLAWVLLWGWILPQTPLNTLELATGDNLLRLLPRADPAPLQILSFKGSGLQDRITYAQRVEQILAGGAKGVILQLPLDFERPLKLPGRVPLPLPRYCFTALDTNLDCPLAEVVARYYPQIIVTTEATPGPSPQRVLVYNHVQSFTEDAQSYRYPLETVLAVTGIGADEDGITRRMQSTGQYTDSFGGGPWPLTTTARLAVQKWLGNKLAVGALGIRFGPPIPIHSVESRCTFPAPCRGVKDQIIFFGPQIREVLTPQGLYSSLEIQGHMIMSLLAGGYGRVVLMGQGLIVLGATLGLLGIIRFFVPAIQALPPWPYWLGFWLAGMGAWGLTGLGILALWKIQIPVFFVWGALTTTLATVYMTEVTLRARQALFEQQRELERLRRAERQAILNQARKLLYRVATDIHDNELQRLKLVMDDLETYLFQPQPQLLDRALDKLEAIGLGIRNELGNIRTLADKLEITPELKGGLCLGIQAHVREIQASHQIPIELVLEPLQEPLDQSNWLDAREDIFRFFREALANALRHGRAGTYIRVQLTQNNTQVQLIVENDGVTQPLPATTGYGTKAMNTIGQSLPSGQWKREWHEGRVTVWLSWEML